MEKIIAAIDCGTNSIRMLISKYNDGVFVDVYRGMKIIRLGQGVDKTGVLHPEALSRAFDAVKEFMHVLQEHNNPPVRFIATSASRDARNVDEFFQEIKKILGVTPEIISGEKEAKFTFKGATYELMEKSVACDTHTSIAVIDIGGGSTEIVFADNELIDYAISLDVGSVRLHEKFFLDDPPSKNNIHEACGFVQKSLLPYKKQLFSFQPNLVIGVAGTITTLAAMQLKLRSYDPRQTHGFVMTFQEIEEIAQNLCSMTREEKCLIPAIHPERADVISAGALCLTEIMRYMGISKITISEKDILDGIIYESVSNEY